MTYQRILSRNDLREADYDRPPNYWPLIGANLEPNALAMWLEDAAKGIKAIHNKLANLGGDLRRLERDARDENAIALRIESRTGVPRDIVAAVLAEFFAL